MEKELGIEISNSSTSKEMILLYGLEKLFSTNQKSDLANLPICKRAPATESLHLRRQVRRQVTENPYQHNLLPLCSHTSNATPGRPADIQLFLPVLCQAAKFPV